MSTARARAGRFAAPAHRLTRAGDDARDGARRRGDGVSRECGVATSNIEIAQAGRPAGRSAGSPRVSASPTTSSSRTAGTRRRSRCGTCGRSRDRPRGRLVLMTAVSPTPAGEGKTTTTVGLGDALTRIGERAMICLREPALGPVFGMKGGAAGGGYAQVVPMEDINLHFTGRLLGDRRSRRTCSRRSSTTTCTTATRSASTCAASPGGACSTSTTARCATSWSGSAVRATAIPASPASTSSSRAR